MSFQASGLKRGLLGYRREQVTRLLAERDQLARQSEGRVRAAEAHAVELDERVAELQGELAATHEEMDRRERTNQTSARFLTEELSTILAAAEESATRIMERARTSTEQQVKEADRVWREIQAELSRFAAWRERLDPAVRTAQSKLEEVRAQVQEVPERIRRALAPMADTIAAMDHDLAELGSAVNPPLLVAPSGAEPAPSPVATAAERSEPAPAGPNDPTAAPASPAKTEPPVRPDEGGTGAAQLG